MNEQFFEIAKVIGVNGSVLAVTTWGEFEIILKCVVLAITAVWSAIKVAQAWRQLNMEKDNK